MGQLVAEIKPFDADGTLASSFIDVSEYVSANVSNVRQSLDLTDLDIGVLRNASIGFEVDNSQGTFNDVDDTDNSIFAFKRAGSLVRLSWRENERRLISGLSTANSIVNAFLGPDQQVFEGFLTDDDFTFDAIDQIGKFSVLGKETLLEQLEVSTADFNDGDAISDVMFTILNKPPITDYLTVEASNINPAVDQTIDDKSQLSGETVKEAMSTLLLLSNSVLRIVNDAIVISARESGATVVKEFYNQTSTEGAENLIAIRKISSGLKRTFNYLVWPDGATVSDAASQAKFGVRKKEIGNDVITTTSKQEAILNDILAEFASPRQSFELVIPLTYENLDIALLDRVAIDYRPLITGEFGEIPVCGEAVCGEAISPSGVYNFILDLNQRFEVIERRVNFRGNTIVLSVREVVS